MSLPNPANAIARGTLFPAELVPGFLNQVKGRSSLAALCGAEPIPFNGKEYFTFNMDNDVDIVAEAGAKSAGGGQVGSVTIVPIKIEYGMRVSDEFIYGSEEVALDLILKDAMRDAHLYQVTLPKVADVIKASATFEERLAAKDLCHMGQPSMICSVTNCEKRTIGTNGGFGYRSINEAYDIALMDSMILAQWICGQKTKRSAKRQRSSY